MEKEFTKKPPKQNLTVRVDGEVLDLAKKRNINVSQVIRHALEQAVHGKLAAKRRTS